MLALTMRSFDRLAEWTVRRAFADAEITIGGDRPWDIRVLDPAFYPRLARNPPFQLGETYMDGLWECDAIDELMVRLLLSGVAGAHERRGPFHLRNTWARLRNHQSRARAGDVATAHYDLDTALYRCMLDDSLTYTCAYWRDPAESLETAQCNKMRMICDKLDLQPGQSLLDIGCGFGGLAGYAAEHYGVSVVGVTNSVQHYEVAHARYAGRLPVEFMLLDYRDLPTLRRRFDKISSIEMIEAVGPKNFETFMKVAHECLADGGRFLLQSFVSGSSRYVCNEWFDRYIFPNGVSPSFAQLARATETNFGSPRDAHDLAAHYPPTLLAWDRNLRAGWGKLAQRRYDDRFRRMWHFYLTCLAGVFRAEDLQLCQIVYGKGPV
ncbi:MAG: cyclopropane fatty acyl phospholipid synthase, partial [Myxococcales bacterium]|nr:cyclopropane fatty acyl phospholipid synthase [Myxococcales bacterium]